MKLVNTMKTLQYLKFCIKRKKRKNLCFPMLQRQLIDVTYYSKLQVKVVRFYSIPRRADKIDTSGNFVLRPKLQPDPIC